MEPLRGMGASIGMGASMGGGGSPSREVGHELRTPGGGEGGWGVTELSRGERGEMALLRELLHDALQR